MKTSKIYQRVEVLQIMTHILCKKIKVGLKLEHQKSPAVIATDLKRVEFLDGEYKMLKSLLKPEWTNTSQVLITNEIQRIFSKYDLILDPAYLFEDEGETPKLLSERTNRNG